MDIHVIPAFKRIPQVVAGFSTRQGGVSKGPFEGLNIGLSTQDKKEDVAKNRMLLQSHFNWKKEPVSLNQIHSDILVEASENWKITPEADGLYTGKTLPLLVYSADCLPILFYLSDVKIVGAIHAGWRGTQSQILSKSLKKLQAKYKANLQYAFISLGPCISRKNYEVSEDVFQKFSPQARLQKQEKFYVGIREANYEQARQAGVPLENIEMVPYCSFEMKNWFYSYRRDGAKTGRYGGLISLA